MKKIKIRFEVQIVILMVFLTMGCCRICVNSHERKMTDKIVEGIKLSRTCVSSRLVYLPELRKNNEVYIALEVQNLCDKNVIIHKGCAFTNGIDAIRPPLEIKDNNNNIVNYTGAMVNLASPSWYQGDFHTLHQGEIVVGIIEISKYYNLENGTYTISQPYSCTIEPKPIEIQINI